MNFVAVKDGMKYYIQVCDDLSKPETMEREITPLLKIQDAYPKIILANTKRKDSQHEGVKIIDIAKWLIGVSQF